jgi:hypothetical protein
VTTNTINTRSRRLRVGAIAVATVAVIIAGSVALLHGPVVPMALTGDSYQWVQHAHLATHRPAFLVADLDTFYRPSTTWTLVADRLLWGGFEARGYRTTSLVLHGLAALALAIAGRRIGLGWVAAATVALVWVTSPFTDESAFVVAYRFQPLLLVAWLVLIAVWPRAGTSWSFGRVAAAAFAVLAAAAAKETWVVTPVLVAALEFDRRRSLRSAAVPIAVVGSAVVLYVVLYFMAFPTSKSYYALGAHVLGKVPRQLAVFMYLEESLPFALTMTWLDVLAVVVVVMVVVACLRWGVSGTGVALFLLVVPSLPTLMVPYTPQRYLAIPYTGFLLLVALWVGAVSDRLPKWRSAIRGTAAAVALLVIVAGAAVVRSDLEDYRRMAAAHTVLLDETAEVAGAVVSGVPTVVVRDEQVPALLEILREPRGVPKLPYTRHEDPYGLIDTAALFEWVIADEDIRVAQIRDWKEACDGVEGVVLVHIDGRFVDLGVTPDLALEAERWQAAGRHVRVVRAVPLD